MSTRATKTGASASPLQRPFACRNGAYVAEFGGYWLESALQPIFSLSHQRPVGCEALIRARDAQGKYVPPPFLFGSAKGLDDVLCLDRICRSLHLANFRALDAHNIWLFLNVNPLVAIHESQNEGSFKEVLEQYQIPTHQVVAEIVETAIADETVLERSVNYYKQLGCMVAIDDFGAGHSNFERIWRLAPDIVKLVRAMVEEAARRDLIARSLPDLVSLKRRIRTGLEAASARSPHPPSGLPSHRPARPTQPYLLQRPIEFPIFPESPGARRRGFYARSSIGRHAKGASVAPNWSAGWNSGAVGLSLTRGVQ